MSKQNIEIISTGGTFDKVYSRDQGALIVPEYSHVPDILSAAGVDPETIRHTRLMSIDSLDMKEWHLREIAKTVHRSHANRLLITHGTDKMVETAEHLAGIEALADRAIMLTGAMEPFAMGKESDASFNLGFALAMIRQAGRGVYVAMHGEVFPHDKVEKKMGRFVGRSLSLQELAADPK